MELVHVLERVNYSGLRVENEGVLDSWSLPLSLTHGVLMSIHCLLVGIGGTMVLILSLTLSLTMLGLTTTHAGKLIGC